MKGRLYFLDRGQGKPVVWIHGYPLSSRIFNAQLSIPGYRHIVPDLPGFGDSPASEQTSMESYAGEILSLLDELRIHRAVFAGLSMGGYITLAIARSSPERIAGLILIDTRELADSSEGRQKRREMIGKVQNEGIEVVLNDMLPKLLSQAAGEPIRSRVAEIIRSSSVAGVIAALRAMADRPDSSDLLARLTMPVLVMVGSEDVITPPADARRISEALPNGRLRVLQGAGHLSNLEKPDEFNAVVADFLRQSGD